MNAKQESKIAARVMYVAAVSLGLMLGGCTASQPVPTTSPAAPVKVESADQLRDRCFAELDRVERSSKYERGTKMAWTENTKAARKLLEPLEYQQVLALYLAMPSGHYSFYTTGARVYLAEYALARILEKGDQADITACISNVWIYSISGTPLPDAIEIKTHNAIPILTDAYGRSKSPVIRNCILQALTEALPMIAR